VRAVAVLLMLGLLGAGILMWSGLAQRAVRSILPGLRVIHLLLVPPFVLLLALVLRSALLLLLAVGSVAGFACLPAVRNAVIDRFEKFLDTWRFPWIARVPAGVSLGAILRKHMLDESGYVYLGTDRGKWILAHPEHAVLVLGPPRQGKTTGVVIQNPGCQRADRIDLDQAGCAPAHGCDPQPGR